MRTTWVCVAIHFLGCTGLIAEPVSPHAQKAVATIQQLRAIGLPNPNDLESGPPAKVPALLRVLNQELKALIIEDLNDQDRHAVPSEDEILQQLAAAGWEEIPSHKWNAYGEIRQIKFDWRTGYEPGMLIVSTQLWIPCGSVDPDSAIYVFQGMARRWELVLAAESDFNPTSENDETGLQYEISPPDSRGRWFLVVAHVPPSCRRPSSMLHYMAFRAGGSPEQPVTIISKREAISPFFGPAFKIHVEKNWFAVVQGKVRKLDGELGIAVFRFELGDAHARRVAPLAITPVDFLDQWVQMDWTDAERWTMASSDSRLEQWHLELNNLASDSTEIESVHKCPGPSDSDENWMIELSVDQRLNPSIGDEVLFVNVAKRGDSFSLAGVHKTHPPGCPGKTPLRQIIDHDLPHLFE